MNIQLLYAGKQRCSLLVKDLVTFSSVPSFVLSPSSPMPISANLGIAREIPTDSYCASADSWGLCYTFKHQQIIKKSYRNFYKLQQVSWDRCLLERNPLVILSLWQKGFSLVHPFEGATDPQFLLESSCFLQKAFLNNDKNYIFKGVYRTQVAKLPFGSNAFKSPVKYHKLRKVRMHNILKKVTSSGVSLLSLLPFSCIILGQYFCFSCVDIYQLLTCRYIWSMNHSPIHWFNGGVRRETQILINTINSWQSRVVWLVLNKISRNFLFIDYYLNDYTVLLDQQFCLPVKNLKFNTMGVLDFSSEIVFPWLVNAQA